MALTDTYIAVILVPGVMGTRLAFKYPKGPWKWDPDSVENMWDWANLKIDDEYLILRDADVQVIGSPTDDDKGWSSVFGGSYLALLKALKDQLNSDVRYGCGVYAAGYVWTKSNRASAAQLAKSIAAIRQKDKPDAVVIVTHSMGGLVARAALKLYPEALGPAHAMIHVAQPVTGAPKAYRQLITGATDSGWFVEPITNAIFGKKWWKNVAIASAVPSLSQLLPSSAFRLPVSTDPSPISLELEQPLVPPLNQLLKDAAWLYDFRTVGGVVTNRRKLDPDVYKEYTKPHFPGVCFRYDDYSYDIEKFDKAAWGRIESDLARNLQDARAFHDQFDSVQDMNTAWVASIQFPKTDIGFVGFTDENTFEFRRSPIEGEGDKTVPLASASALPPLQQGKVRRDPFSWEGTGASAVPPIARILGPKDKQFEHQKMCISPDVQIFIVNVIKHYGATLASQKGGSTPGAPPPVPQATTSIDAGPIAGPPSGPTPIPGVSPIKSAL